MARYFIDESDRFSSECVVDNPVNPDGMRIVEIDHTLSGNVTDYVLDGSDAVFSPKKQERVVPNSVTRYQGRAALLQIGLLDDIDAHYAALPTDTADEAVNLANRMAKERWAGMLNFERDSEELVELASAFGMSATQVDDLFCFAETIK